GVFLDRDFDDRNSGADVGGGPGEGAVPAGGDVVGAGGGEADRGGRGAVVVDEAAGGGAGVGVGVGCVVDRLEGEDVAGAVDEGAAAEGGCPAGGAGGGDVVGAGAGEVAGGVGAVPAGVRAGVFLDRDLDGRDRGAGVGGCHRQGAVPAGRVVVGAGGGEADRGGRGAV